MPFAPHNWNEVFAFMLPYQVTAERLSQHLAYVLFPSLGLEDSTLLTNSLLDYAKTNFAGFYFYNSACKDLGFSFRRADMKGVCLESDFFIHKESLDDSSYALSMTYPQARSNILSYYADHPYSKYLRHGISHLMPLCSVAICNAERCIDYYVLGQDLTNLDTEITQVRFSTPDGLQANSSNEFLRQIAQRYAKGGEPPDAPNDRASRFDDEGENDSPR